MPQDLGSRRPRIAALALAALVATLRAAAAPAQAPPPTWTPLGPYGGTIEVLAADPLDPLTLYVGTRSARVFRTVDGGLTWTASRGLEGADTWIEGLAADPSRPGVVWAGDYRGQIFVSEDHGATWTPDPFGRLRSAVRTLLVLRGGGTVLAGTDGGAFRRNPHNGHWSRLPGRVGHSFNEDEFGVVWAGTTANGTAHSRDQGKTWIFRSAPDSFGIVFPLGHGRLLGTTQGSLLESVDNGRTWQRQTTSPTFVTTLARAHNGRVYASNYGLRVFSSRDGHAPWTSTPGSPGDSTVALALSADDSTLYVGTFAQERPGGVFRSRDRGATWSSANRGLDAQQAYAVAATAQDPALLYLSAMACYRSSNGGVDLQVLVGLASIGCTSFAIDPSDAATVVVAGDGIVRTTDGVSWTATGGRGTIVVFDPNDPRNVWAGGDEGFGHSADTGVSWTAIPLQPGESPYVWSLAVAADGTLYAAGFIVGEVPRLDLARIYRVSGDVVTRLDGAFPGARDAFAIAADPVDSKTLYLHVDGVAYKTTDGAAHWSPIAVPDAAAVVSLALVPAASSSRLVVALASPGYGSHVMESADGGLTWSPLPSPPGADTSFLRLATSGGRLFAFPMNGVQVLEPYP